MSENQKLVVESIRGSDDLRSEHASGKLNKKEGQKICVSDKVDLGGTEAEHGDSFVVDMEGLSHVIENDMNGNSNSNSTRITRNLTRKASMRGVERKSNGNEKENTAMSSPRASLIGGSMPEKIGVVGTAGADHAVVAPQVHHQITIASGCVSTAAGKGFGLRRSSRAGVVDSRKIFFIFATLSCMGTILLIYFTLSMGKIDGDDSILD